MEQELELWDVEVIERPILALPGFLFDEDALNANEFGGEICEAVWTYLVLMESCKVLVNPM